MTVHHRNCGTMCPRGARLLAGRGGLPEHTRLIGEHGDEVRLICAHEPELLV